MSKANNLTEFLTDVADAIRYSAEKTETINPQSFSDEIRKLKLSEVPVSLTSGVMLSGDNLDRVGIKQKRLTAAINGTVIDGETVYKITQQINDDDNSSTDTIFYTKEGDAGKYYYVLSSIDNFLNKVSSVSLITFSIASRSDSSQFKTYQAEEGMTWEEFLNSEYDKTSPVSGDNLTIMQYNNADVVCTASTGVDWDRYIIDTPSIQYKTDVIVNGTAYTYRGER